MQLDAQRAQQLLVINEHYSPIIHQLSNCLKTARWSFRVGTPTLMTCHLATAPQQLQQSINHGLNFLVPRDVDILWHVLVMYK